MSKDTLSGRNVRVETVIMENNNIEVLAAQRNRSRLQGGFRAAFLKEIIVPDGHEKGWVSDEAHREHRAKREVACVDVVICTRLPGGEPAVVAIKRAPDQSFGGKWWMQGGEVSSYIGFAEFVAERAKRECGVAPMIEGMIGVFRTCAEDHIGDTLQVCYVGSIPYAELERAQADKDHSALRLLTKNDLDDLPEGERHWYPMRVFYLALATTPDDVW